MGRKEINKSQTDIEKYRKQLGIFTNELLESSVL